MAEIEVFADVGCAFTHVGLRRLVEERRRRGRADVVLVVRAWPLELVNGHPLRSEQIAAQVTALRRDVDPAAFAHFAVDRFPASTLPALALAAAAYRVAPTVGETVSLELRDALFEAGAPIDDPDVLAAIATRHGVAPTAADDHQVRADWADGQARGVLGSPHFFIDADDMFCPSLTIAKRDGRLDVAVDVDRYRAFIERCFS